MYKFFVILIFAFLIGCSSNQSDQVGDPFLCICSVERSETTEDGRKIQDKYFYIVQSIDQPDCCSETPNANHTGWHEVWKEDDLDYPGVWSSNEEDRVKINPFMAQQKGCVAENAMKQISDLSKFPISARNKYPELTGPPPQSQ